MSTSIATTTSAYALSGPAVRGYGRWLARATDGTLVAASVRTGTTPSGTGLGVVLAYSKDNGSTWTDLIWNGASATVFALSASNASIFIDSADNLHLVYKQDSSQSSATADSGGTRSLTTIYYQRMTPNAGRTVWTAGAAVALETSVTTGVPTAPDIVVVPDPATGGWSACIVASYLTGSTNCPLYTRLPISSGGSVGAQVRDGLTQINGSTMGKLGGSYGVAVECLPTIDFNHTGDGKTTAGSTPHLYAGWTGGSASAASGIRFRKATYSSGAWTWGTERAIDTVRFSSGANNWLNTLYDGTRVIMAGTVQASGPSHDLMLYERDAADTTTTVTTLASNTLSSSGGLFSGTATYDSQGNVYLIGRDGTGADGTRQVNYRKWTRSTTTLGSPVLLDSTGRDDSYVSAKRGNAGSRVESVRMDGTVSPYTVVYDGVALNTAPNAPTLNAPVGGVTVDRGSMQRFSWTFSDPDPGDSQSAFDLQYRVGTGAWTTVTQSTPNTFYDAPGGTFAAATYEWQVRTYDALGLVSPWSASAFFVAIDAPAGPTITNPTNGATISTNTGSVTWSQSTQDGYQVRKVADNAGAADTTTVYFDSGQVVDATTRTLALTFPVNNRFEHIQVRTQTGGIWSPYSSVRVNVSYTPPATPTLTLLTNSTLGRITVTPSHPTPSGGQPTVSSVNVHRRLASDTSVGIRIAKDQAASVPYVDATPASGVDYAYRVEAVGSNGTSTFSAWVT